MASRRVLFAALAFVATAAATRVGGYSACVSKCNITYTECTSEGWANDCQKRREVCLAHCPYEAVRPSAFLADPTSCALKCNQGTQACTKLCAPTDMACFNACGAANQVCMKQCDPSACYTACLTTEQSCDAACPASDPSCPAQCANDYQNVCLPKCVQSSSSSLVGTDGSCDSWYGRCTYSCTTSACSSACAARLDECRNEARENNGADGNYPNDSEGGDDGLKSYNHLGECMKECKSKGKDAAHKCKQEKFARRATCYNQVPNMVKACEAGCAHKPHGEVATKAVTSASVGDCDPAKTGDCMKACAVPYGSCLAGCGPDKTCMAGCAATWQACGKSCFCPAPTPAPVSVGGAPYPVTDCASAKRAFQSCVMGTTELGVEFFQCIGNARDVLYAQCSAADTCPMSEAQCHANCIAGAQFCHDLCSFRYEKC